MSSSKMKPAFSGTYHYGLGRRKTAIAKVRLYNGQGQIVINAKPAGDYFAHCQPLLEELKTPLVLVDQLNKFDISILVQGSGQHSQAEAIRLGISRALLLVNPQWRDSLKAAELLGRDPRAKERKKFGLKGARKKRQFTKR